MAENTSWRLPQRGPGRLYQQPDELIVNEKFDQIQEYVQTIAAELKTFLQLETAVRFLVDGPNTQPLVSVVSVPFEGEQDTIYSNFATLIYYQLWGYYLSADPKSTHHGLTTVVLDGYENSLVRRETEKFLDLITTRHELGGRAMKNYHMACDIPQFKRDVYLKETINRVLDIHLGVRLFTYGEGVERKTIFMPISAGAEAVDRIYYNLEHIIHQNLVAYDEVHDHYLPVSEELILRELESLLERSLRKGNTRKKLVNGLKLHTVLLEDPAMNNHISLADLYYDKINRIDLLEEASQRSRDMFATALIRSTEITQDAGVNVDTLAVEERVYIERPESREAETVPAGGAPAQAQEEAQEETVPATQTDGLTEL